MHDDLEEARIVAQKIKHSIPTRLDRSGTDNFQDSDAVAIIAAALNKARNDGWEKAVNFYRYGKNEG
jgi:hypothetical protein